MVGRACPGPPKRPESDLPELAIAKRTFHSTWFNPRAPSFLAKPKYLTRELLGHGEVGRARSRSSRGRDLNLAGFRAGRNRGCDLNVRHYGERSLHPAERDLGR